MIRLVLADDHKLFLAGMVSLIEEQLHMEVVGQAEDGKQLLGKVHAKEPDVALVDINMPVMDGLEATRRIKRDHPSTRVIVLTMYNSKEFLRQSKQAGVSGSLLKNAPPKEMLEAIRTVAEGGEYFMDASAYMENTNMEFLKKHPVAAGPSEEAIPKIIITKREREVLRLLAQEYPNKQIADKLFISEHTVNTHRRNLLKKLDVNNSAGLVRIAFSLGLFNEGDEQEAAVE